jgi:hypothetical protein
MEKELQNKPWTKTWWGYLIMIVFLPITLTYLVWKKTEWKSYTKGLATAGIIMGSLALGSSGTPTAETVTPEKEPVRQVQEVKVQTKTEQVPETVDIPFETETKDDSSLTKGTTKTQREGSNGKKEIIYSVTYQDGKEISRVKVSEKTVLEPVSKIVLNGTYVYVVPVKTTPATTPTASCDPNYSGACVPIASDVDCGGGSGDGPAYLWEVATVVGTDKYGLDKDKDGLACE